MMNSKRMLRALALCLTLVLCVMFISPAAENGFSDEETTAFVSPSTPDAGDEETSLEVSEESQENSREITEESEEEDDILRIEVDVPQTVSVPSGTGVSLKFVPTVSASYLFYSVSEYDLAAQIWNMTDEVVEASDDDSGERFNFRMSCFLEQGKTYTFMVATYNGDCTAELHLERLPAPQSMTFVEGPHVFNINDSAYLSVSFEPENADDRVTFQSENTSVAFIEGDGLLVCQRPGSTTITATSNGGLQATYAVQVLEPEKLEVGTTKHVVVEKELHKAVLAFTPEEDGMYRFESFGDQYDPLGCIYNEDWGLLGYSSDFNALNFCLKNELEAGKTYYYAISMESPYDSGNCDVLLTKMEEATGVAIREGKSRTGFLFDSFSLHAAFQPENAIEQSVSWKSDDSTIATVNSFGTVTLKKPGSTVIHVTSEKGLEGSITVTAVEPADLEENTPISFDTTAESQKKQFAFTPSENGYYGFSLTMSRWSKMYLYDSNGSIIKSLSASGSAELKQELQKDKTYYISVYEYDMNAASFTLEVNKLETATGISIKEGETYKLPLFSSYKFSVVFEPKNYIPESISWSSSDESVATINSEGRVEPLKCGTTVITATSQNGLQAMLLLTVTGYQELEEGKTNLLPMNNPDDNGYYFVQFMPKQDGVYSFYSVGAQPPYCDFSVFDENKDWYSVTYESPYMEKHFRVDVEMTAGITYYYRMDLYSPTAVYAEIKRIENAESLQVKTYDTFEGYPTQELMMNAEFLPLPSLIEEVTWSSSDESILTVDDDGIVTLVSVGTASVIATSEAGLVGSAEVTVMDFEPIAVGDVLAITLDPMQWKAFRFVPEETGRYILYSKGSAAFAHLKDEDGNVIDECFSSNIDLETDLEAGKTYTYWVAANSEVDEYRFTLCLEKMCKAEEVLVDSDDYVIGYTGMTWDPYVYYAPDTALYEWYDLETSDPSVVSVRDGYEVTLLKAGTADVTVVSESGLTKTVTIKVLDPTTIELNNPQTVTSKDKLFGYGMNYFTFVPEEDGVYVLSSSGDEWAEAYLSDENNSLLKESACLPDGINFRLECALKAGQTYVYRVYGNEVGGGDFEVVLQEATDAGSFFLKEGTAGTYPMGAVFTLHPQSVDVTSMEEEYTWTVDNSGVISVDRDGEVQCLKEGTGSVLVTGVKSHCSVIYTITVVAPEMLPEDEYMDIKVPASSETVFLFTPSRETTYYFRASSDCVSLELTDTNGLVWSNRFYDDANRCPVMVAYLNPDTTYMLHIWNGEYFENSFKIIGTADLQKKAEPTTSTTTTTTTTITEPTTTTTITTTTRTGNTDCTTTTESQTIPTSGPGGDTSEISFVSDESSGDDSSQEITVLLGDANDDGAVDMKDVLLIRKYLAHMTDSVDLQNADANKDGSVDMKDVLLVRKYLAHIVETL